MRRAKNMAKRAAIFSAAFCVCSSIAWDASAQSSNDNRVTSLNYSQDDTRTVVKIGVQSDPTFSVYSLRTPERVVVEILDCNANTHIAPVQVRNGVIDTAAVSISQANDYDTCRVILGLEKETTYTVDSTSNAITIAVNGKPNQSIAELENEYAALQRSQREALQQAQAIAAREQANREKLEQLEASYASANQRANELEQNYQQIAAQNSELQRKITAQNTEMERLNKEVLEGSAARRKLKQLEAKPADNRTAEESAMMADLREKARDGRHALEELNKIKAENAELRAMLETAQAAQKDTQVATTEGDASRPALADIVTTATDQKVTTRTTQEILADAPLDRKAAAQASIRDLQFKTAPGNDGMQVIVKMSAPVDKVETIDGGNQSSTLKIAGAVLPDNFNKKFDTSAFNQGIRFVDSTQANGGIELVAQTSNQTIDSVEQNGDTITWNLRPVKSYNTFQTNLDRRQNAMVSAAAPSSTMTTNFTPKANLKDSPLAKRKITLDINDAEITDLLRLLSDEINTSIVVSPDVKGKITLSLKSVPLDQALDIILRMHDLGMRYEGSVIWIAKAETFRAEAERALKEAESMERMEPLEVRLIPVNYATASDIQGNVQSLLSSRGSINIDTRTNTLILKDVAANLDAAELLVNNLDTQTPQILIEARIVETQANFTKELGIQWGGDGVFSAATGNPTGIVFPSSIGIAGGSTSDNNAGTSTSPNFAVNLPASVGTGTGGALGISLGSIGGAVNLNIRLSALETKGFLKIVSSPRIMTLDNIQASIEQGTSIPVSVVSAAGAQTSFFDASLNLQVTPHVTRDGNVYLKIDISKNEPDFGNTGANGDPSILRKQAHTELLVPDGETTVIGGIYTRNTSQSLNSVPFFGSIPILGYLFRSQSETDNRTELLIFITPKIINRDASIAASGHDSFIPPVERESKKK